MNDTTKAVEYHDNGQIRESLSLTEAHQTGKLEIRFPFRGCSKVPRPSCASISLGSGQVDIISRVLVHNERDAFVREAGMLRHELGKVS